MKVSKSVSIDNIDFMTVKQLKDILEKVPDGAKCSVSTHKGDYNRMDYHSMSISWSEELDAKPEKIEEFTECQFDKSWVGRCKRPTSGKKFCSEHLQKKCYSCKEQATRDCEATIGAFVCGEMMCDKHSHHGH